MMQRAWRGAGLLLCLVSMSAATHAPSRSEATSREGHSVAANAAADTGPKLPVTFEANAGQWDERVRFATRQGGATLFLTDEGMTFALREARGATTTPRTHAKAAALKMALVGAEKHAPQGEKELVGKSNYFLGSDPAKWRTDVPSFGEVRAKGWLAGVDVVWHGREGGLEYDLEVEKGVDARKVELSIEGATKLEVAADGALHVATAAGTLVQKAPRVLQGGRVLPTRYEISGDGRVRFDIEGYDTRLAVVIDPVLAFSTFLGGSSTDGAYRLALDGAGNVYVTGQTYSADFPNSPGAYDTTIATQNDVFVAKLNASGTTRVYSTYLGGASFDQGFGIAVDASGNAYVTGDTYSTDFPTTGGAFDTSHNGGDDAFVAKLNATGSALSYSTFIGGSTSEGGSAVAVDASGNAYIAGSTSSTNYPTTAGALRTASGGSTDAFVTKVNTTGTALVYSTFLGGSGADRAANIKIDSSGAAFVVGNTASTNFPTTAGAVHTTYGGGTNDAFVAKLSSAGTALVYSTFLGGSGPDVGTGLAIDGSGNAFVTGYTQSTDYPTTAGAYATTLDEVAGCCVDDAFVTKLNASGSAAVYSTYLGGSGYDQGWGVAVDAYGSALVLGSTTSDDFPLTKAAFDNKLGTFGDTDAFVAKFNASGSALVYATYLGGSASYEDPQDIVLDASGNAYVTGTTNATDFVTTAGAFDRTFAGSEAFVSKITSANGEACGSAAQCSSGLCVDGVCCNSACGGGCDRCDLAASLGTCTKVPAGSAGVSPVCAPFLCDGVNAACPTSCTSDAQCVSTLYCAPDGTCQPRKALGTACNAATDCKTTSGCRECASGFCADGFCCDTACGGTCEACAASLKEGATANGTCGPIANGTDPGNECTASGVLCGADGQCNGAGGCRLVTPDGVSCGAGKCEGTVAREERCDGAGACGSAGTPVECAPFLCDVGHCTTSCTTTADCASNGYCSGGVCVKRFAAGVACTAAEQCASKFCVDGFCCNAACDGQCEACDAKDAEGTCVPVAGNPHPGRAACPVAGAGEPCKAAACDGSVRDSCAGFVGPSVACGTASCTAGMFAAAGKCDGKGTCKVPSPVSCGAYACGGTMCKTDCAVDGDCAPDHKCDAATHKCTVPATCDGDHTTTGPTGEPLDCSPYKCQSDGTCRSSCESVSDCVSPTVCDVTGKCVSPSGDTGGGGGGGCSVAHDGARNDLPLFGLALAAVAVAHRRKRARRAQRSGWLVGLLASAGIVAQGYVATDSSRSTGSSVPSAARRLPVTFEANAGQWDERVRFVTRQGGATLFLTDEGMTFSLRDVKRSKAPPGASREEAREARSKANAEAKAAAVKMTLVGAGKHAPQGEKELATRSNYFLGSDPAKWRTDVPSFGEVRAKGWLAGVEVVWHGREGALEYDLEVERGVDARKLELAIEGATKLEVVDDGALHVVTTAGVLVQKAPRVLQGGRVLPTRYVVSGEQRVRFDIEGYDSSLPVVIDPALAYSTYLGANADDEVWDVAVDGTGAAYVFGDTNSTNFPTTTGALRTTPVAGYDLFVTKLNPAGKALVYSTYLGGADADYPGGIAVDTAGSAYITGRTSSTNFPTTAGAYRATITGTTDAYLAKLNVTGSALVYSTFVGGDAQDVAVDGSGSAYLVGNAGAGYPTTAGAFRTTTVGGGDAFVSKFNTAGTALVYSTFLGGTGAEAGAAIAVDGSGSAYVTGGTSSTDFPTTAGAFDTTANGAFDGFVTKLNPAGSALAYSTYVGGSSGESGQGIAVDATGNAYITGQTRSTNYPTSAAAFHATLGGGGDVFVTKVNAAGTGLAYSTYVGGSGDDDAYGIAVDGSGFAHIAGFTESTNFPVTADALRSAIAVSSLDTQDAFMTTVNAAGTGVKFSTYIGGAQLEYVYVGLAADSYGSVYVTGYTYSTDFVTTPGAYQVAHTSDGGKRDTFVVKIARSLAAACTVGAECASGFCADGVCCNAACSAGGCDRCNLAGKVGTCTIAPVADPGAPACATGYACDGVSGVCPTSCTKDSQCATTHYCAADGTCQLRKVQGAACNAAASCKAPGCRECVSTFCVDGVCCDTACVGTCQACAAALKEDGSADGTCGPTKNGLDPRSECAPSGSLCGADGQCNGGGNCRTAAPVGVSCGAGKCEGNKAVGDVCDGSGACGASPAGVECSPFICSLGGCTTTCATTADCATDGFCSGTICEKRHDNGQPCTAKEQCLTNLCVDGVCCNAPCSGQCEACDVSGAEGTCTAISDAPHAGRTACDPGTAGEPCTAKACDGTVRTSCETFVGPKVACGMAACTAGVATSAGTCDTKGSCQTAPPVPCGAFACDTAACKTECTSNADCASGASCDTTTKKCVSGAACDGDHTTRKVDGSTEDCAPYKCQSDGTCRKTCNSVSDCVAPHVCDPSGTCVAPEAPPIDEGGCSVAHGQSGDAGVLAGLALALAFLRRRPRRR